LSVTGLDTDSIGRLAFESGVIIFELSSRRASLEDTFFELTGGNQQFAFGAVSESDTHTPDTTPGGVA
jgi:ABC-2 type transport system ATP-binding protein